LFVTTHVSIEVTFPQHVLIYLTIIRWIFGLLYGGLEYRQMWIET